MTVGDLTERMTDDELNGWVAWSRIKQRER